MLYQAKSYLRFLLRSTNQHGVHSPFVYQLITQCFYDSTKYPAYKLFKQHRNTLLSNNEIIEVTDFGAGSRVFTSNVRKVSAVVKNAGISYKRQRLLWRLVKYLKPSKPLELGTSLGMGTMAISLGAPNTRITTIEGCPATSAIAQQFFDVYSCKNIDLHNESFENFFSNIGTAKYDLVYIDGNHSKERTLSYFNILLNHIHNHSVLIFDDIYWSREMTEAWSMIKEHTAVTVSIDTFQWGLVFFRKEQEKQHFTVRL